jgi:hypothetical protein
MLLWYAVYKNNPQDVSHLEERAPRAPILRRFDDAAKLGTHNGRVVYRMWLIDDATQPGDVIRYHGAVPSEIVERHVKGFMIISMPTAKIAAHRAPAWQC